MATIREQPYKSRKKSDEQLDLIKTPPQSIEAEQAVLGGLMLDNSAWDRIADRIKENDFYHPAHRLIFRAMQQLIERSMPFDVLTISENLRNTQELDNAGGEVYLFEMARNTPTAANIVAYAGIVKERSVLRQLIQTAGEIAAEAFNNEGKLPQELLETAESKIFKIGEHSNRGKGPIKISSLLAEATERLDTLYHSTQTVTGVATGFTDLDDMTSGLQPGELIIVAGRPSMGKTAFAMNIAENVAITGKNAVLVFSMEMSGASLAMRLLSSWSRVDQQKVRTGKLTNEDWDRIISGVGALSEAPLYIDDTPGLSPVELRARARRLARECKSLGLIVIDYLQLMQVPGNKENRATEISEISRSLKALAKELNIPVIALSQLNRSLETRNDKRPMMSDLRECVTGNTHVLLSDGTRQPINKLVDMTPSVFSVTENGKIISTLAEKIWWVGKKPVFDVHLASGKKISATAEHRLLTLSGWKSIETLKIGDRLATAHKISEPDHCDSDLFWDRIVAIEEAGVEDVYDLTVPGTSSWLADGIVSHNSGALEQDADLIMFIYRDEVYNEESPDKGFAEIIIGKQRNGPIGIKKLTFSGQYTRFENFAPNEIIPPFLEGKMGGEN